MLSASICSVSDYLNWTSSNKEREDGFKQYAVTSSTKHVWSAYLMLITVWCWGYRSDSDPQSPCPLGVCILLEIKKTKSIYIDQLIKVVKEWNRSKMYGSITLRKHSFIPQTLLKIQRYGEYRLANFEQQSLGKLLSISEHIIFASTSPGTFKTDLSYYTYHDLQLLTQEKICWSFFNTHTSPPK